MTRRLIGVTAVLMLLAVACGGEEAPTGERPSSTATVRILEPQAGDVVTGDTVSIRVELEGGTVVERVSRDLTPDEGHIHIILNGSVVSETFGLEQEVELEGPGRYLLEVEFVALDHAPFDPRVLDSVTFTAE